MRIPMRYTVRWFDPGQSMVREETIDVLEGTPVADVLAQRFEASGGVVLAARPVQARRAWRREAVLDVGWWCRELRTLVAAGMTVVEALETVNAQPLGAARARANAELVRKLHEGKALSVAMREVGIFPAVLVAGVAASERTSGLVEALDEYVRYDDMLQRLRKQVVSAAIYPAVVVTLGLAIVLVLLLYVVPRFSLMYRDLHGSMSTATRILVWLSGALAAHGAALGLGAVAIVGMLVLAWRRGTVQRGAASVATRIRPLQRQIDQYRLAKLYQSLTLMFRGGYPLDEALAQCAALGLGARMDADIRGAGQALARGSRISVALGDAGLSDAVAGRLLAVGERTGNFDRVLQTIAERHAATFTTFVERATRIVEPILLLVVALVVGGIVIMMYMPVFDIASSLN
jgi:general secretion pathway protein F